MQEEILASLLADATSGDDLAREKIIRHYQPYILNTVGRISGKFLTWSDEEASIGLVAFNRSIDAYRSNGGRTFLNYVYLLIQRDLIDYFRKEKKQGQEILSTFQEESPGQIVDVKNSLDSYQQQVKKNELVEEILEFSEELKHFKIEFEDLEKYTPKHRDTRKMVVDMASSFMEHPELIEEFLRKKRLPIKAFLSKTSYNLKTVERHRNYLVPIIVIKLRPEWRYLSQFIQTPVGSGNI